MRMKFKLTTHIHWVSSTHMLITCFGKENLSFPLLQLNIINFYFLFQWFFHKQFFSFNQQHIKIHNMPAVVELLNLIRSVFFSIYLLNFFHILLGTSLKNSIDGMAHFHFTIISNSSLFNCSSYWTQPANRL